MAEFQRDPTVVAYEAFKGIRNDVIAPRFALADLAVGTNIDIDETGAISRREGRTSVVAGATRSLWADGADCYFMQAGTMKRLNPNYTSENIRTGMDPLRAMQFQKVNEQVFYSNGIETGVIDSRVSRSWGLTVPPTPGVAVTVGALPAGDYQFTMTYLRRSQQESGAGLAGRITVAEGSGLVFTLPVSADPDVVSKAVYLSTQNGDVMYRALIVGNGTATATYQNDTRELFLPLATQFLGPPPAGHLIGYFRGHMYVAVGDTIFYSEPYAFEHFDLRRYLSFDSRITLFAPVEDRDNPGVFVGTETSISWLAGAAPDEFKRIPCTDYGAIAGAVAYIDGATYGDHALGARMLPMWMAQKGICIGLPGGMVQNTTRSRYAFTAQGVGCALFKPDTTQFIAVSNY